MKCVICNREAAEGNYCRSHMKAYEKIVKSYGAWKKALEISWKEYLSEIVKNPLTGEYAKEVAECLVKGGENQNVAES